MKRWHWYIIIGLIFGIVDWFYLDWLASGLGPNLPQTPFIIPVIILLNYGIWLVPIIPIMIYEVRQAKSIKTPILAGILTWCTALLSYYIFYTVLLSLGKLPHLEHLNIFGQRFEGFGLEYWQMFKRIILWQLLEWIPIGIIGGGATGAFFWWVCKKRGKGTGQEEKTV